MTATTPDEDLGDLSTLAAHDAPAFFGVVVSNHAPSHRGTAPCWSPRFSSMGEARQWGKAQVDAGKATLSFVVRVDGTTKEVMPKGTHPASARRIIDHWEELWGSLEE